MIVLTREPGEAERLAEGAPNLQRIHGMPIDPRPYPRTASSEPACLAVVAARERAPGNEEALLRRLRVRVMQLGLVDDPELIAAAAGDVGLDPAQLEAWCAEPEVRTALEDDAAEARSPSAAARALDHKLGGPRAARRYTAPSYELSSRRPHGRPCPASTRSRRTRRRSRTSRQGSSAARGRSASARCSNGRESRSRRPRWRSSPGSTSATRGPSWPRVARPLAAGADFYWELA